MANLWNYPKPTMWCPRCRLGFTRPESFRAHYAWCEDAITQCWGCLKNFANPQSLAIHMGSCWELRKAVSGQAPVKLHLTAADCSRPSTWWYQARAIADRIVQHG